jgi:drug/metabolite transporter (DMT)-like permease
MLAAVAVFSAMDASMKVLTHSYPPLEVSCLRGLSSVPVILLGVAWRGAWRQLRPIRWRAHVIRAALAVATLSLFVLSLRTLLLSETYALFLCEPLIVTALSALLLREHVGWHRWGAILIGFGGVVIMLHPNPEHFISAGAAAALSSALCYALGALTIRVLAREESTLSVAFSCVLAVGLVNGLLAAPHWIPLRMTHWPWIAAVGVSGAIAQLLLVQAFRSASPMVIAPFEYTALLWGLVLDWLLWHTLPGSRTLTGALLVTSTGLYVIYREHRRPAASAG